MKKLTAITLFSGLVTSVAAAGCGGSSDATTGEGTGSTSGVDGGIVGTGSAAGAGGILFGAGGTSAGSGGATHAGGAAASGSAAGATASGGTHGGGPITVVTPVGGTDAICANQSLSASAGILDVFIMLDRSKSMEDAAAGGTKWEVITSAIDTFVKAPESASMNAGIGFFGIGTGSGGRNDSSCTAADYAKPAVAIAALGGASGNAAKISTAIDGENPGSNTPTQPALQGALDYAKTWAKANPTHKVVVVFATDGLPNGCNSSIDGAAKVAASGVSGTPSIQTYVIGVFGDEDCPGGVTKGQACTVVTNTNQIAKGGGTGSAFIVNASAETGAQFLGALNAIRGANQVGCDFKVPAPAKGKAIDFSRATVRYTPGKAAAQTLPWKPGPEQCNAAGGWYYNSATAPNHVLLCESTCKAVTADTAAKIDVVLACEPPGTNTGSGGTGNGAGGTGSGAGGTGTAGASGGPGAGGTGSGSGGEGSCLLAGQSCQTAADCCGGLCTNGVCASNIR